MPSIGWSATCSQKGWVTGLADRSSRRPARPANVFQESASACTARSNRRAAKRGQEIYVVAEKILSGDEPLPTDWAVCGTTGYDLLNII